mgnify:CR=1 FL=1
MIPLNIQIPSFIVSLVFGVFVYIMINVFYKVIYNNNIVLRVICSVLFTLFLGLIYFFLLLKINNGFLHIYFFLCVLVGYCFCFCFRKKS